MKPFNVFPYDSKIDFMRMRALSTVVAALISVRRARCDGRKRFNFAPDHRWRGHRLRFDVCRDRGRAREPGKAASKVRRQNLGTGNDVLVRLQEREERFRGCAWQHRRGRKQATSTAENRLKCAAARSSARRSVGSRAQWHLALVFVVVGFLIYISFRFQRSSRPPRSSPPCTTCWCGGGLAWR
jgi:preprotein translocase subunit SecF